MQLLRQVKILSGFILLSISFSPTAEALKVGVFQDQLALIQQMIQQDSCPALSPQRYADNQMLAEYLIFCHALAESGLDHSIELVPFPVVSRMVDALDAGGIDLSGFGVWFKESQKPNILQSSALLNVGEFSKGLYALKSTRDKINWPEDSDFIGLIAVANSNWTYDWQELSCSKMRLLHVGKYEQMFSMLALKRADILPLAFGSGENLKRQEFGVELYPVTGVKIPMKDSAHILVSKHNSNAAELLKAINQGLDALRKKQLIQNTYHSAGVVNPQVKDWAAICAAD